MDLSKFRAQVSRSRGEDTGDREKSTDRGGECPGPVAVGSGDSHRGRGLQSQAERSAFALPPGESPKGVGTFQGATSAPTIQTWGTRGWSRIRALP